MSAKEKVVRYMAATRPIGEWYFSYELSQKFINGHNTGIDADTRLYEIINKDDGKFYSSNFIYYIERRRQGKYTEFRIARKERRQYIGGLRDYSHFPLETT